MIEIKEILGASEQSAKKCTLPCPARIAMFFDRTPHSAA
jgi:hypothetical protein